MPVITQNKRQKVHVYFSLTWPMDQLRLHNPNRWTITTEGERCISHNVWQAQVTSYGLFHNATE